MRGFGGGASMIAPFSASPFAVEWISSSGRWGVGIAEATSGRMVGGGGASRCVASPTGGAAGVVSASMEGALVVTDGRGARGAVGSSLGPTFGRTMAGCVGVLARGGGGGRGGTGTGTVPRSCDFDIDGYEGARGGDIFGFEPGRETGPPGPRGVICGGAANNAMRSVAARLSWSARVAAPASFAASTALFSHTIAS